MEEVIDNLQANKRGYVPIKQLRKRATQLMNECNSNKNLLLCLIIMYHNEFVIYACCLSDCVLMITKCRGKIFITLCSPQLIFVCVCVCVYKSMGGDQ